MSRRFLVITAYFDDSGSEGKGPVFVMAGLMARAEMWASFFDDWKAMLDSTPTIKYLKMKEAHRLHGQFRGISEQERDKKISEALRIIRENVSIGMFSVLRWEDMKRFIDKFPRLFDLAYPILFYESVLNIVMYMQASEIRDRVDIIYDDQQGAGLRWVKFWPLIKELWTNSHPPFDAFITPATK